MIHGKREQLLCSDVDSALRSKNIEPLYGFECAHYIPLRHSSGGGKEIYYPDDQEVDLANIISSPLPKLPSEVTIRTHWLAVEGVQPSIPENPPPLSLQVQKEQALSQMEQDLSLNSKELRLERKRKKDDINAGAETIAVKSLHPHSLSLEQQLYYKELTDASIGLSDSKRQEALNCISSDPGLYQLLPQLVIFIGEGIKVNISQRKLINLMNILKITKALMDNSAISIEKYLHNLIPALVSCLLNKQLCQRPESEDQWSLRDLAAKILASICKKYSNTVNNIQTRITKIYSQALCNNGQQGLAVHYGAVVGFGELSQESVVVCVVPRLKQEGELIKAAQIATAGPNKLIEQVAANKLQTAIQKYCVPHLIQSRPATDTLQSYQQDYGYLGTSLFNQVKSVRQGKTRPSPLTLGSPQVTVTKIQTPKGPAAISLGSPTLAGNLRLQITSSSPSSGGSIATIPVSLLSAVVNNPSVAQAVLASQLGSQSEALSSVVSTLQELTSSAASASNNNNNIKTTK
jgi:transcription initiation factor TFIID subunit 6